MAFRVVYKQCDGTRDSIDLFAVYSNLETLVEKANHEVLPLDGEPLKTVDQLVCDVWLFSDACDDFVDVLMYWAFHMIFHGYLACGLQRLCFNNSLVLYLCFTRLEDEFSWLALLGLGFRGSLPLGD